MLARHNTNNESMLSRSGTNRQSFINFGASGKKSPMNRAHINRMTQNLVANNKSYLNRRSTMIEQVKQPIPMRDMWKPQTEEADDGASTKPVKPAKAWFKTKVKFEKDVEYFETEEIGSDEDEDDVSHVDDDSVISGESEEMGEKESPTKKKSKEKPAKEVVEVLNNEPEAPDYGNLVKGVDIIDDDISMERAYNVFRELERNEAIREFKPPRLAETGGMAIVSDSRFAQEIPS